MPEPVAGSGIGELSSTVPVGPYERAELVPEVVRRAEQLRIDPVWVPAQTVRITRRITTETVTLSVQVRREVVSLEHLPVPDGQSVPGGAHETGEHLPLEVVLSQEVPIVTLQTRPYERVHVGVQEIDGETTVRDQVRVEQVDIVTVPPQSDRGAADKPRRAPAPGVHLFASDRTAHDDRPAHQPQ